MSPLVLVRAERPVQIDRRRLLAAMVILVAFAIIPSRHQTFVLIFLCAYSLFWIGFLIVRFVQKSRRMWVRDTNDGFDVIDGNWEFHVADRSITSLAIEWKPNYVDRVVKANVRLFTVWSDSISAPIPFETHFQDQTPDPLEKLTTRIWNQVLERTKEDIQTGASLKGENWCLNQADFTWGKSTHETSIKRSEISACKIVEGHLRIWRTGQVAPFVSLPSGGRNVCLLPHLLGQPGDSQGERDDTPDLGRILFERRPEAYVRLLGYLGGAVLIICGIALLLNRESLGTMFLYAGVPSMGWAYWTGFNFFRCGELGIQRGWIFGQADLRYADIETFTYAATRHFSYGVYTGTRIGLYFVPTRNSHAPRINFVAKFTNNQTEIENLRDFIANTIATRMRTRVFAGEVVTWTNNLAFTRQGILYRPSGFVGRQEAQLLRYSDLAGHDFVDGLFYLFRRDTKEHVMSEQASATNFFPGYSLYNMLREEPEFMTPRGC